MSNELRQTQLASQIFEQLAVAQAIFKTAANMVDTKNDESLRAEATQRLYEMYQDTGVDRVKLKVGGETVGYLSIVFTKAQPKIINDFAYNNWLVSNDLGHVVFELDSELIPPEDMDLLYAAHPGWFNRLVIQDGDLSPDLMDGGGGRVVYKPTGEIIPGLIWESEQPKGTILSKFNAEGVFNALRHAGIDGNQIMGYLAEQVD